MNNNELMHFGVLGMKWGVRRSQAQLGKKSPNKLSADYKESRKMQAKGPKSLSTKELRDLTARLQLEKQYKDLNPSSVKKGFGVVKTITAAGTTVAGLYALSKTPMAQDVKKAITRVSSKKLRRGIDYIL